MPLRVYRETHGKQRTPCHICVLLTELVICRLVIQTAVYWVTLCGCRRHVRWLETRFAGKHKVTCMSSGWRSCYELFLRQLDWGQSWPYPVAIWAFQSRRSSKPSVTTCTARFNFSKCYVLPMQCVYVLCRSEKKQRLFRYKILTDWFLKPRRIVFTERYELSIFIQFRFMLLFKCQLSSNRQQDRQCTYNVTLKRIHEIIVAVEKQWVLHISVYVCVFVDALVRGRLGVCVRVCSFTYQASNVYVPCYSVISGRSIYHHIRHYLINGTIFRKKLLDIKFVFWFSLQFLSKRLLILRLIQRDIVINVKKSSCKVTMILARFKWNLNFLARC